MLTCLPFGWRRTSVISGLWDIENIITVWYLLEDSPLPCTAYSHGRHLDYPECQGEITYQPPIHLLLSLSFPCSFRLSPLPPEAASHRSDLSLLLLSCPDSCPSSLSTEIEGHLLTFVFTGTECALRLVNGFLSMHLSVCLCTYMSL